MIPMNRTMTVEGGTPTKGAGGGMGPTTYAPRLQGIPCCVMPVDTSTVTEYAQRRMTATQAFLTTTDIGAKELDRLVLDDGTKHQVLGYQPYVSPFGLSLYLTIVGTRATT